MSNFDENIEQRMITHMSEDHIDAMHGYYRLKAIDTTDTKPKMIAIDFNGFNLQVDN